MTTERAIKTGLAFEYTSRDYQYKTMAFYRPICAATSIRPFSVIDFGIIFGIFDATYR
jgi:hypothetical protein